MPGGISWKCNEVELNERGDNAGLDLWETDSWIALLEEYSDKELTYHSDRLIAIMGIVNDMRRFRSDSFKFGVWESQLPAQLAWRAVNYPARQDEVHELPSWSWAARGGEKLWLLKYSRLAAQDIASVVGLMDSGCLRVSGNLVRVGIAPSPVRTCCIEALVDKVNSYDTLTFRTNFETMMLPGTFTTHEPVEEGPFLIVAAEERDNFLGLAKFDAPDYQVSEAFCLILMSSERAGDDPWYSELPLFLEFLIAGFLLTVH